MTVLQTQKMITTTTTTIQPPVMIHIPSPPVGRSLRRRLTLRIQNLKISRRRFSLQLPLVTKLSTPPVRRQLPLGGISFRNQNQPLPLPSLILEDRQVNRIPLSIWMRTTILESNTTLRLSRGAIRWLARLKHGPKSVSIKLRSFDRRDFSMLIHTFVLLRRVAT